VVDRPQPCHRPPTSINSFAVTASRAALRSGPSPMPTWPRCCAPVVGLLEQLRGGPCVTSRRWQLPADTGPTRRAGGGGGICARHRRFPGALKWPASPWIDGSLRVRQSAPRSNGAFLDRPTGELRTMVLSLETVYRSAVITTVSYLDWAHSSFPKAEKV